jgi:hypothetical protein
MRIRMNDDRERRLKRVQDLAGENTKSGAIDVALAHYIADVENKRRVADELPSRIVEELHTPWLPLDRDTTVGRE